MKYKVLKGFYDAQDNKRHYRPYTEYPREGLEPAKKRLEELGKGGFIELPKEKPKKVEKVEEPKEETPKKDSK